MLKEAMLFKEKEAMLFKDLLYYHAEHQKNKGDQAGSPK